MTINAKVVGMAGLLLAMAASSAMAGRAVLDSYQSAQLGRKVSFSVYLPDGYDKSDGRFPAVYLLHGLDGNQNEWLENGTVGTMNALIRNRSLRPMLAIMPSFGEQSWWIDGERDKAESALLQELIPYVEGKYKVERARSGRAVAGWSMGGYGALNLALKHAGMFCAAAVISPEIYDPLPAQASGIRRTPQFMRKGVFDPARWEALNYPAHLDAYRKGSDRVPIWIVTGDDDRVLGLVPMAARLYSQLNAIEPSKVELRVIDGELDWATVRRALPGALDYLDRQCRSK